MTEDAPPQPMFARGNDHLDRLLPDPQVAADVGQAAVSWLESREDMLLSTLYHYLTATRADADAASIVVIVHGQRIELDLGTIHTPRSA